MIMAPRRRRRVAMIAPTVVEQVVQPSGRTLRNRRRRARRAMGLTPMNSPVSYYGRYFEHNDPTMVESVHKLIQTQFYPQKGIYRSVATGLETSALAFYQGSFEWSSDATNNFMTLAAIPSQWANIGSSTTQNAFIQAAKNTTFSAPYNAAAGNNFVVSGPFTGTNPSTVGRVVSFTMNIIPASTVLNRGGEGKIGYLSSVNGAGDWSRSSIDNLAISRSWDGAQSMSIHWTPGVEEYQFSNGNATVNATNSEIQAYLVVPLGTTIIFRVEWQIGIEYVPNVFYRPLVDRKPPGIRPDARYFLNAAIQRHWTPLMISTFADYQNRLTMAVTLGGHAATSYIDHAGIGGGFVNPASVETGEEWEEIDAQKDGIVKQVIGSMTEGFCNVTGDEFCQDPMGTAGRYVTRKAAQAVGGYVANRFVNRARANSMLRY